MVLLVVKFADRYLFEPKCLILLDAAETPLYHIDYELRNAFPQIRYESIVADVKTFREIRLYFEQHTPTVVFHCAAYKHVPLWK